MRMPTETVPDLIEVPLCCPVCRDPKCLMAGAWAAVDGSDNERVAVQAEYRCVDHGHSFWL